MFDEIQHNFLMQSGAKGAEVSNKKTQKCNKKHKCNKCKSCRSRQELSNEYVLAKISVYTPRTGLSKFAKNQPRVRKEVREGIAGDAVEHVPGPGERLPRLAGAENEDATGFRDQVALAKGQVLTSGLQIRFWLNLNFELI